MQHGPYGRGITSDDASRRLAIGFDRSREHRELARYSPVQLVQRYLAISNGFKLAAQQYKRRAVLGSRPVEVTNPDPSLQGRGKCSVFPTAGVRQRCSFAPSAASKPCSDWAF